MSPEMKLAILSLGIFVSLWAQAVQPAPVTDKQVDRWLRVWQKRLGLVDWQVTVQIARASDLKPDTMGNLRWNSANHTANIKVMSPLDYDLPAGEVPTDMEFTVLHELIHLQLSVLPRNGSKELEERVVNRMGEALFMLEKGSSYRPRAAVAHLASKDKSQSEASRSSR